MKDHMSNLAYSGLICLCIPISVAIGQQAPVDYWTIEDGNARAALPEFKIIPAAKPSSLTPANGYPKQEAFVQWHLRDDLAR